MDDDIPKIGGERPVPDEQPPVVREEGNVRILRGVTALDIPIGRVLAGAEEADLEICIVVGRSKDGKLWFASSRADGGDVLWELERAKAALLRAGGGL